MSCGTVLWGWGKQCDPVQCCVVGKWIGEDEEMTLCGVVRKVDGRKEGSDAVG